MLSAICVVTICLLVIENIIVFRLPTGDYSYIHVEAIFMDKALVIQTTERMVNKSLFNVSSNFSYSHHAKILTYTTSFARNESTMNESRAQGIAKAENKSFYQTEIIVSTENYTTELEDEWLFAKKIGDEEDYPIYTNDTWNSLSNLTPIPLHIQSLFPRNFSNKTLLFAPPRDSSFRFKKFDVLGDNRLNITEVLGRWETLSLPFFYKKASPLRFPPSFHDKPAPFPR